MKPFRSLLKSVIGGRKADAVEHAGAASDAAGRGDWTEAVERLATALETGLRARLLRRTLDAIRREAGAGPSFGTFLGALRERAPDNPDVAEFQIRHRFSLGDFAGAETEAGEMADRLAPGDEDRERRRSVFLGLKALAIARQCRLDEAWAVLDDRLAGRPDDVAAREEAAGFALDVGDFQRARQDFRHAYSLDPTRIRPIMALAGLELDFGNYDAASGLLEGVDHRNLRSSGDFLKLVFLYLRTGDRSKAAALLHAALADGFAAEDCDPLLRSLELCPETAVDTAERLLACEPPMPSEVGAYVLLDRVAALVETEVDAFAAPAWLHADVAARREAILAGSPSADFLEYRDQLLRRHEAVRQAAGYEAFAADQPVAASFLCPIHRPHDVANAARWIGGQSWTNAEAVFAINSADIGEDAIRAAWRSEIPLRFVDCIGIETVGGVLNRAVGQVEGEIVLKFDADNYYLPGYALDMLLLMRHFGSKVVSKTGCKFHYFVDHDLLAFPPRDDVPLAAAPWGAHCSGSTLGFETRIAAGFPFQTYAPCGEDTAFFRQCIAAGLPVHYLDPFNFVTVRSSDPDSHTWKVDGDEFYFARRTPHLIGNRDAIDRYVRV